MDDRNSRNLRQFRPDIDHLACHPTPCPQERFRGRGILTCAGGRRLYTCAWVQLNRLRELGCKLPIEVWYRGSAEMNTRMVKLLESIPNVRCIDAFAHAREHGGYDGELGGWELKSYAVLNCGFQDVLFIDADNVPTRDPAEVFDWPEYHEAGAVFWPDRYMGRGQEGPNHGEQWKSMDEAIWEAVGLEPRDEAEWEAGQFAVDKVRCWAELKLAAFLNRHSDFFYQYLHGDKDTFRMAWHKCGKRAAVVPHPPGKPSTEALIQGGQDAGDTPVIYQHDFAGNRLFQHRAPDKWAYDGGNLFVEDFVGEQRCHELVKELRQRWDGVVRHWPDDYTDAEREAFDEVVGEVVITIGNESREAELREDFTLGHGATAIEQCWGLEPDWDGSATLWVGTGKRRQYHLKRNPDSLWTGLHLHDEHEPVTLEPAPQAAPTRRR